MADAHSILYSEANICNSCILCFREIQLTHERYLIAGKSKFNIKEAIQQLPFKVFDSSPYICRQCLDKLRKRASLISQEKNIVAELSSLFQKGKGRSEQERTAGEPPTKRLSLTSAVGTTTLPSPERTVTNIDTPTYSEFRACLDNSSAPAIQTHSTPVKEPRPSKTYVNVKVAWPSKNVEKTLHPDLESLGKMLVRGTFKQIANAAWRSKHIRKHLTVYMLQEIDKECSNLCSRKNPSCLRSPSKQKMLEFSFERENEELEKRAPLFYSVLVAGGSNRKKTEKCSWVPAVGMAASVLLRNRSPYMNAVQLMLGIFLYHSNWAVSLFRFFYSFIYQYHTDHLFYVIQWKRREGHLGIFL